MADATRRVGGMQSKHCSSICKTGKSIYRDTGNLPLLCLRLTTILHACCVGSLHQVQGTGCAGRLRAGFIPWKKLRVKLALQSSGRLLCRLQNHSLAESGDGDFKAQQAQASYQRTMDSQCLYTHRSLLLAICGARQDPRGKSSECVSGCYMSSCWGPSLLRHLPLNPKTASWGDDSLSKLGAAAASSQFLTDYHNGGSRNASRCGIVFLSSTHDHASIATTLFCGCRLCSHVGCHGCGHSIVLRLLEP